MNTVSLICNLFIFVVTAIITLRFFWKDGMLDVERGKNAFRYFTVQSNVLCGLAALLLCLFAEALLGMLPSIVYGIWYLYKVVLAPAEKRWEDFYGFNKGGKWPVYFVAMTVGELLICLGLMALQNV